MAARRAQGIGSRSLMRGLAGARSFARFLERNGKGKVGALAAVRAPKVAKTLPKPLADRRRQAHRRCRPARRRGARRPGCSPATPRCWRCFTARGCASPRRSAHAQGGTGPGASDTFTVTGKGNKPRMVPVLPQVLEADRRLRRRCARYELAAGRRRCSSARAAGRCRRASCNGDGAAARRARPARHRDAARAAAFLRHASPGPRRRPARDPGIARPRLAIDHADLHRGRHRALLEAYRSAHPRA